jgi:hypothetical protein
MFHLSRRAVALAASTMLGLGGAVAVAVPALAEPSGCNHSSSFWVTNLSTGRQSMHAEAWGGCNTSASRTLRAEIKQDISFQSDPLVAANSDSHYGTQYDVTVTSCDNNNSKTYYGRGFYTSSPSYVDTPHYSVKAC